LQKLEIDKTVETDVVLRDFDRN